MIRKSRVVLMMAIVGLVMAIGLSASFLAPTAQASHIKMFDMNDRGASKDYPYSGSGVSVVNGSNVDFMIQAEGLLALELYELRVMIRVKGPPLSQPYAMVIFEVITDAEGKLSFEKSNFNMEFLPPGVYRVDWMITHASLTDTGRGLGANVTAMTGRDPLLLCQPATTVTVE